MFEDKDGIAIAGNSELHLDQASVCSWANTTQVFHIDEATAQFRTSRTKVNNAQVKQCNLQLCLLTYAGQLVAAQGGRTELQFVRQDRVGGDVAAVVGGSSVVYLLHPATPRGGDQAVMPTSRGRRGCGNLECRIEQK